MDIDTSLIRFLTTKSHWLVQKPISGDLTTIRSLYNTVDGVKKLNEEQFEQQLQDIESISKKTLEYNHDGKLTFINSLNLDLLMDKLTKKSTREKQQRKKKQPKKREFDQLMDILQEDSEPKELIHLRSLLNFETTAQKLTKERVAKTTPLSPFLQTCNDQQHSQYLAYNSDPTKFSQELSYCVSSKIHFIPIIKPHTDISLGDCSYLDTCHKLDSCRYLHYKRHIPLDALDNAQQEASRFNEEIPYWEMLAPYTHNGSTSNLSREVLPPQWINCDVRNFDFTVLGKFAAVIADPAWNIHMNLPYGTCNDTELLNLPLHTVQDEGILLLWVTGRAIEIGKQSLVKWGYTVKNEVVWIKTNQLGRTICTGRTGHWLNHSKEHLLVGVKGDPEWLDTGVDVDFLVSGTRETSRKPDELYGMVERLVGPHARKLEIFGRDHNTRPGWFTIGNQLKGNHIFESDVQERYDKNTQRAK